MGLLRILFVVLSFSSSLVFADAGAAAAGEPVAMPAETVNTQIDAFSKALAGLAPANTAKLKASAAKILAGASSCDSKNTIANTMCGESTNPGIMQFISENSDILSMIAMGGSMMDQCSSIAKVFTAAGAALAAYQIACKVAQTACNSACDPIKAEIQAVNAELGAALQAASTDCGMICQAATVNPEPCTTCMAKVQSAQGMQASIQASLTKTTEASTKKTVVCNGFKVSTQAAVLGGITALQGLLRSKEQCKKIDPEEKEKPTPEDCQNQKSTVYSTKACMCFRSELAPAQCQDININPNGSGSGLGGKVGTPGAPSIDGGGGGGSELPADESSYSGGGGANAGSGGAPPPSGGGGAGMGGGGGGGGGAQDGAGNPNKKLNANILGGFGGGGGGGGGGAGPGYDSGLKEYNPGGEKDPSRSIAAQMAKEVSPPGGRSNFEKVRIRYNDNRTSLMGK